jgi:peptidoglycan/LPS O-acetylase OafA/YrhL
MSSGTGSEAARVDEGRAHLPTLDGLRGLAVAAVMVAHLPTDAAARIHKYLPQLMHMSGYLGVDLFFVLSGFLITRILLADRESGTPLRFFLIRRCLRIFPVYYLTLAIYAIVAPSTMLVWCAMYLSNYYFAFVKDDSLLRHTWSLSIEEHFYLLWPLLAHRLAPRVSLRVLLGLMLFSLLSSTALVLARVPQAASLIYQGTPSRVWSLAVGALVAFSRRGVLSVSLRHSASYLVAGIVFAVGAIALGAKRLTAPAYLAMVPGYSLISLSGLMLALTTTPQGLVARLLSSRALRFTGRISYGLYLFHPIVYRVFMAAHGERPSLELALRALLAVAAVFVLATLSYRFFESYFLRLKAKFERNLVSGGEPAKTAVA